MNRQNFCAAPWSGLSVDPDGSAKICCISSDKIKFTGIGAFGSDSMIVGIKQSFINDQQHKNCNACWAREQNSSSTDIDSRRSIYQYDDFYNDLNNPTAFKLEHLDLRWNNTCNLNCVYCSPTYSSKWAQLLNKQQSYRVNPEIKLQDIKNLKYLQLAGGEPMLIKENITLLENCLSVNPDLQIEVTTNLTAINNNRVYDLLKKFTNVRFVISFESIEKRFEYIRNGSVWTEFAHNLDTLAHDFGNIEFNMVYFPLSAAGIGNAIKLAQQYTQPEKIYVVAQFDGHGFDKINKNSVQYIKELNTTLANTLPDMLNRRLMDQVNLMSSNCETTQLPNYDLFDQLTNQNHKNIFTELYQ
jgi:sulfatase maturation enzyme AslB (radical SAM superfamily)